VPAAVAEERSRLESQEHARRRENLSIPSEIDSALTYVQNCVEVMPELRSRGLQLAVDRSGTFLPASIHRQFGGHAQSNEGGSAPTE